MTLFDFGFFARSIPELLTYLPVTLFIAVFSFVIALFLGFATALIKIHRVPVVKYAASLYLSVIRGTPMLVQLFVICYGIPKLLYFLKLRYGLFTGFDPNAIAPIYYAILAFTVNLGAYLAETIRSALGAVGRGQWEAAQSVGMTYAKAMGRILLPQALRVALPSLAGGMISTVKDTSFIFIVGIIDVMGEAQIIGARAFTYLEVYVAVALIYWLVCFLLEKWFMRLEKAFKKHEKAIA